MWRGGREERKRGIKRRLLRCIIMCEDGINYLFVLGVRKVDVYNYSVLGENSSKEWIKEW